MIDIDGIRRVVVKSARAIQCEVDDIRVALELMVQIDPARSGCDEIACKTFMSKVKSEIVNVASTSSSKVWWWRWHFDYQQRITVDAVEKRLSRSDGDDNDDVDVVRDDPHGRVGHYRDVWSSSIPMLACDSVSNVSDTIDIDVIHALLELQILMLSDQFESAICQWVSDRLSAPDIDDRTKWTIYRNTLSVLSGLDVVAHAVHPVFEDVSWERSRWYRWNQDV